jgi:hypothetical protein
MGQERKPEAGEYKHNDAEHRVWIFDRDTCSLVCFVLRCGPKRYLTPQLLGFSLVLDRIVHLPVPSENVSWRGKKISESLAPTTEDDRADGTRRGTFQRKIKETNVAKRSAETPDVRSQLPQRNFFRRMRSCFRRGATRTAPMACCKRS